MVPIPRIAFPALLAMLAACDGADPAPASNPAQSPEGPAGRYSKEKYPLPEPLGRLYVRPAAGEEPQIRFESEHLSLGEVAQGSHARAAFSFSNEGPGLLQILALRPHCGCTVGRIDVDGKPYVAGTPIAKGSRGSIEILFQANAVEGARDLDVDLLTNDPARASTADAEFGEVRLRLTVDVVRFFEWEGGFGVADLGRFPVSSPQSKVMTLTNTKRVPYEVLAIEGAGGGITASAEPDGDDRKRWRIRVSTDSTIPLGPLTHRLHVKTDGGHPFAALGAELYVTGTARGSVETVPPMGLRFLVVPRGTSKRLTLILLNDSGKPWSVANPRWVDPQSAALDPPAKWRAAPAAVAEHLEIERTDVQTNRQVDVAVTLRDGMPPGAFSLVLAIDTGLDDGPPTLAIPVMGVVR